MSANKQIYPDLDIPLLNCTQLPVLYSRFYFGGDDLLGICEKFLNNNYYRRLKILLTLEKDLLTELSNIKNLCSDITNKEIIKQYQLCRHSIITEAEKIIINSRENKETLSRFKTGLQSNENARLKIVEALGGIAFCKTIPIIYPDKLHEYMNFKISDITEDHSIFQYEDKSGRKGVLVKIRNKIDNTISLMHISQRYRETCVDMIFYDGKSWMSSGVLDTDDINKICQFLTNPPDMYEIMYKLNFNSKEKKMIN
jgi:hypothetical protein